MVSGTTRYPPTISVAGLYISYVCLSTPSHHEEALLLSMVSTILVILSGEERKHPQLADSDVDVICFGLSVEMNFVSTSSEIYFPVTVKLQSQNWRIY